MTTYAEDLAASRNFLTQEDVRLLKLLASKVDKRLQRPSVADVGCGSGTTGLAILETLPQAVVFSYDTSPDAVYWTGVAMGNAGVMDRWVGTVMDSVEAANDFEDHSLSLVMLDASHLYEATRDELQAWAPKVAKRGWLWCHDYLGDGGLPGTNGVRRALDEFAAAWASQITDTIQGGLGIALRLK